jgi:hypothetical protein
VRAPQEEETGTTALLCHSEEEQTGTVVDKWAPQESSFSNFLHNGFQSLAREK